MKVLLTAAAALFMLVYSGQVVVASDASMVAEGYDWVSYEAYNNLRAAFDELQALQGTPDAAALRDAIDALQAAIDEFVYVRRPGTMTAYDMREALGRVIASGAALRLDPPAGAQDLPEWDEFYTLLAEAEALYAYDGDWTPTQVERADELYRRLRELIAILRAVNGDAWYEVLRGLVPDAYTFGAIMTASANNQTIAGMDVMLKRQLNNAAVGAVTQETLRTTHALAGANHPMVQLIEALQVIYHAGNLPVAIAAMIPYQLENGYVFGAVMAASARSGSIAGMDVTLKRQLNNAAVGAVTNETLSTTHALAHGAVGGHPMVNLINALNAYLNP